MTQQLENEGIEKFIKPYESTLLTIETKRQAALTEILDPMLLELGEYQQVVTGRLGSLEEEKFSERLWRKDGSLWHKDPETQLRLKNSLGWLHVPEKMESNLTSLIAFTQEMREAGFRHIVHMGMGGSSLAPLVFQRIFLQYCRHVSKYSEAIQP